MFLKQRSAHLKCPACGHETDDFRAQGQEPITCPQCKTPLRRHTALVPSLLVGLVLGLLIYGIGFAVFKFTQARPIYVIVAAGLIVLVLVWLLSPWLRKYTFRWTKV